MRRGVLATAVTIALAGPAAAQPSWKGENLQYFPAEISRGELVQRMREFSFALGVRCQHCHAGGDGVSFDGVDFSADDKLPKRKARTMLRMVDELNRSLLPRLPVRATPRVDVDCVTCHRGLPLPKTLQTTLLEVIETDGAPAAAARYRELRRDALTSGQYNFDEWEMNELARRLTASGNTAAAIAMLEVNGEFHPQSPNIEFLLGELHLERGEIAAARRRFEATLAKQPDHGGAKRRLAELAQKSP